MMMQAPRHLDRAGVDDVYTLIDYDNEESIDGHLSLGYRRVGLLLNVRLFGMGLTACKTESRRWQFLPGQIGHIELDNHPDRGRVLRPLPRSSTQIAYSDSRIACRSADVNLDQ